MTMSIHLLQEEIVKYREGAKILAMKSVDPKDERRWTTNDTLLASTPTYDGTPNGKNAMLVKPCGTPYITLVKPLDNILIDPLGKILVEPFDPFMVELR